MSATIRVAISGGGLAGATLFHVLHRLPHLEVHIFESASAFKEAGMAVGITRNAQTALELIGPTAIQALRRAGAVPSESVGLQWIEHTTNPLLPRCLVVALIN